MRRWSRSSAGASCFFDDLNKTAQEALVFWRPEACASVVPIWAIEVDSPEEEDGLDLEGLDCRKAILATADGTAHVLLADSDRMIQVVWKGPDPLGRRLTLAAPIELFSRGEREGLTMRRLWDLQQTGSIADRLYTPHPHRERLKMALQALDGRLAGGSWRQVASALFGQTTAAEAWAGPSRFLLDKTRRLYWRGMAYMEDRYREFLR